GTQTVHRLGELFDTLAHVRGFLGCHRVLEFLDEQVENGFDLHRDGIDPLPDLGLEFSVLV
ncbi:hypothetical protein ACSYAD_37080, partial [Acaryochloris marina NIES-2412]|uniref:hypothetical protein n=1 Tax=Acaryochloris marina TaxID=155978 RepID=UPI004059286C